ncbi:hypothetical protein DFH11DRAFT_923369 [Phellopilus nigrolimitatus]|nr:hypothetical protein DFH11DRAFT_923369 [Phellopilus nigrolimitatus]
MAPVTEATLIVAKSILYLKNRGTNHLAVVVDKMFLDVPSEYLLFFQGTTLLPGVWGVGKPVVKSAVRNGLLEILVKVADLSVTCSKRLVIDDIKIILSLLIPPLFVFDSVLVEFAAAFGCIPPKDLQELSSGFTGELDNTWNLFYDRLFEKLVVKHRWDIRNKVHQKDALKACHTCKKRDDGENFKRCSRCKKIVYCSVECQRTDWMKGHKKDCDLGTLCNRYPQKNTVTDQAFLTELVKVDLERHAEDLATLAAKKYPGMPYNRIAFEVHYSRSYPMIDVVSPRFRYCSRAQHGHAEPLACRETRARERREWSSFALNTFQARPRHRDW